MPVQRRSADLVLLLITALWGTTFAVIQQGLAHAGTMSFLTARFAVGLLALAVLARFKVLAWRANLVGIGLGVLGFLGFALQTGGLRYTTAPRSAFLTGLTVILVPTAAALLAKRPNRSTLIALAVLAFGIGAASWGGARLSTAAWAFWIAIALVGLACIRSMSAPVRIAVCLALSGLALLTRPTAAVDAATLKGDLLTLGSTIAFGLSLILYERYAPRFALFPLVFGHIGAMVVLSALGAAIVGWRFDGGGELWGSVVFCGVVATAVCLTGNAWAMQHTTATRASLVYALEPVFAAAFAYVWLGDSLTPTEAAGGGLIVAATMVEPLRHVLGTRTRREIEPLPLP